MRATVMIVGAGPSGLAMSHRLVGAGIDHVVLERGQVGNAWREERWDSLRLLTPNWMTALPGYRYQGDDPNGFMRSAEVVAFLDGYGKQFGPPVLTGVTVESVCRTDNGFEVHTDQACWQCDAVVAAGGSSNNPRVPDFAAAVPGTVEQLTALEYRRPEQLDGNGEVLVVGASSSGVQIADELRRAGRDVTIAVGEHVRLPRSYRGRDIYWWLDRIGQLDERYDEVDDVDRARRHASVQLVGNDEQRNLDLNALHGEGVQVVGRLMAISGKNGQCSGSLANLAKNADLKHARLLRRIDAFVVEHGLGDEVIEASDPPQTILGKTATEVDLRRFSTCIWATGYRPTYSWLPASAFDHRGRVIHDGGVGAIPGLYFLGLPFLRRRRSNLIAGFGADAADLCDHLRTYVDQQIGARALSK